jgi:hypothetical protein
MSVGMFPFHNRIEIMFNFFHAFGAFSNEKAIGDF